MTSVSDLQQWIGAIVKMIEDSYPLYSSLNELLKQVHLMAMQINGICSSVYRASPLGLAEIGNNIISKTAELKEQMDYLLKAATAHAEIGNVILNSTQGMFEASQSQEASTCVQMIAAAEKELNAVVGYLAGVQHMTSNITGMSLVELHPQHMDYIKADIRKAESKLEDAYNIHLRSVEQLQAYAAGL